MGQVFGAMFGKSGPEIDLDLEGDLPPPEDPKQKAVYEKVAGLLERMPEVVRLVEQYTGCQELARTAMMVACHENEQKAFEGLLGAVDSIAVFFKFAGDLEATFPEFIQTIAACYNPSEQLQDNVPQALCKQLTQLVDFAIRFDQVRMLRPNLSNDFSYYRRLLPKFNKHPDIRIKDDEASGMALFTAQHIPMVSGLIKACGKAADRNENVALVLALLGNSCLKGCREQRFTTEKMLAGRGMTGAVVLYDHIGFPNAFNKKAPIKTKEIILALKREFSSEVALLNAIHFSSKNFSDAPAAIANLFE